MVNNIDTNNNILPYKVAIAPMIRVSTPQMRCLWNIIAPDIHFYTEMHHAMAIINNDRLSDLEPIEENGTKAVQIAGDDASKLATATNILAANGWQEINLNAGCPAISARKGNYGLSLLQDKSRLSDCLSAMVEATKSSNIISSNNSRISLKCRIGVDKIGGEEFLSDIIDLAKKAGVFCVIVHARYGWLKGLDPKENRRVPPINYDCVKNVSRQFNGYPIIINGAVSSLEEVKTHLTTYPAVMIGRWIQHDPLALIKLQNLYGYTNKQANQPNDVISNDICSVISTVMCSLMDRIMLEMRSGRPWGIWLFSLLPFLHGLPHGRKWRNQIHNCVVSGSTNSLEELSKSWFDRWCNTNSANNDNSDQP